MGGGLMQLVAMGAQDVYLTGNPQITFFKVVYRRHTNFSKECIEQTFSGSIPESGERSVNCTLARNGDLVQEIYLKSTLNANDTTFTGDTVTISSTDLITLDTSSAPANGKLVRFSANISLRNTSDADFSEVAITAGTIYEVTNSNAQTFKLKNITWTNITSPVEMSTHSSKLVLESSDLNKDITELIKVVEVEIGGQKIDKHYSQWLDIYNELFETSHDYREVMSLGTPGNNKTVYIPLRFWFNRNPGLALPLIALQYHEVKINMTLNVPADSKMSDAKLLVNYVYLDTDERRRFAQVSHEYLIEQIQHTGVESSSPIDMTFNHPVKALFWTAKGDNLGAAKLQLNGHDRASEQPADYYHLVQPYECGLGHCGKSLNTNTRTWGPVVNSGANNNVGMYSFCLKPAEHQPSGTCNFSRIDNARLQLNNVSAGVHLFAMNYNVLRIMSGMGGLAYSN